MYLQNIVYLNNFCFRLFILEINYYSEINSCKNIIHFYDIIRVLKYVDSLACIVTCTPRIFKYYLHRVVPDTPEEYAKIYTELSVFLLRTILRLTANVGWKFNQMFMASNVHE
ncbi:hypothetical protein RCL_jg1226.t1 [Rhizophagus clarus]|uniref:Uncharacterized protein n=1 Tax=Rhizophagus clarus TaxID=94130 RepID=A0A8H3QL97_9GLOM|nr:hypothetical protein RCL_jg1226.t1 [Rhizophagus clarus]